MSESPYVPFYTSDFLAGTGGMTASVKGVYITLLCLIYEQEGPLPQRWDSLARRCGCTLPAFKKAVEVLCDDGKAEVVDGKIWSEKCAKHITHRRDRANSARAAAKSRWQKDEQKQGKADANAMQRECQPEPEPEVKEIGKPISRRLAFSEFWDHWPVKVSKDAAQKAWNKLSQDDRLAARDAVVDGWFQRWRQSKPDANPIHPSTFLNNKRWNDEFPAQFKAITGGANERPSKSADRVQAFVAGARGS